MYHNDCLKDYQVFHCRMFNLNENISVEKVNFYNWWKFSEILIVLVGLLQAWLKLDFSVLTSNRQLKYDIIIVNTLQIVTSNCLIII